MRNHRQSQFGMTLVELLVVITIMVLLLALSVPILRPMLESQNTHNAAQVLAGAFRHARAKAIETGESYGIKLIPFHKEGDGSTVSVELRLHKGTVARFRNPENIRVKVFNGYISFFYFDDTDNSWKMVSGGSLPTPALRREYERAQAQFEAGVAPKGGLLSFETGTPFHFGFREPRGYFLMDDNGEVFPLSVFPDPTAGDDPAKYGIFMPRGEIFAAAWLPPTVMPFGTVVDLAFSGGETLDFSGEPKSAPNGDSDTVPAKFSPGDKVIVSFSPAGHVDFLYINGDPVAVNEMLYFCVGDWDRQTDTDGNSLAEDGRRNLDMTSTYWVTLHPKTGTARIAGNAKIRDSGDELREARQYASEHYFNVGGE